MGFLLWYVEPSVYMFSVLLVQLIPVTVEVLPIYFYRHKSMDLCHQNNLRYLRLPVRYVVVLG